MWKNISYIVVFGVATLVVACGEASSVQVTKVPPTGRLLPVAIIKNKSKYQVPISLINPSEGAIRYAAEGSGELFGVEGELRKDGELVKEGLMPVIKPIPLRKDRVRELKSGEHVMLVYQLKYSELRPGWYELKLSYNIHDESILATEYGLTPMKLEQVIMLNVE